MEAAFELADLLLHAVEPQAGVEVDGASSSVGSNGSGRIGWHVVDVIAFPGHAGRRAGDPTSRLG